MTADFQEIITLQGTSFPVGHIIQCIIPLNAVDSTNSWAKRYIQNNSDVKPSLIIADYQSSGRGRFDRNWISPPGTGLWFSVILEPIPDPREWFCYSLIPAIVTAKVIRHSAHLPADLKWPNDVLIHGRKCCGILIETVQHANRNFLIIGTGININQQEFPDEIRLTATSLSIESRCTLNRKDLLIEWIRIFNEYRAYNRHNVLDEWRSLTGMMGKDIMIQTAGGTFGAVAIDIADDGGLIIEQQGKRSIIYSGDVHFKITDPVRA